MIIFKRPGALQEFLKKKRHDGKKIGFGPTMGALHPGHLSLVSQAKKQNDIVVTSLFVNPTQFNDPEDFKKYPVTIESDILLFENSGVDVLFLPSVTDVYSRGTNNLEQYELGFLETILEGKFRPGHFQGVCQVMRRLLEFVLPDNLYIGQKDYQQSMVIIKLTELLGLDKKMMVHICPTVREKDGLAMSSRNTRLGPHERVTATTIFAALRHIKENIKPGHTKAIKDEAKGMLEQKGFTVDYIEVANVNTLQPVENWDGKERIVALAAAFLSKVRLIDNMVVNP